MTSPCTELHVRDFLRALVDQQDDQDAFGVVRGDGVGDGLQQHRLARTRGGDDQRALAFAQGGHQVEHARREIVRRGLEPDAAHRVQGRQVVEEDLFLRSIGRFEVDGVDLDQREVALVLFRWTDLAADRVPGAQVELADLRGRDVDVVRSGQVAVLGGAQETEAVGQHLEHAFREDQPFLLGLGPQDLEDQLLLLHRRRAGDLVGLGHRGQLRDVHLLEVCKVEPCGRRLARHGLRCRRLRRRRRFAHLFR
jgi:hypothetical protein